MWSEIKTIAREVVKNYPIFSDPKSPEARDPIACTEFVKNAVADLLTKGKWTKGLDVVDDKV